MPRVTKKELIEDNEVLLEALERAQDVIAQVLDGDDSEDSDDDIDYDE